VRPAAAELVDEPVIDHVTEQHQELRLLLGLTGGRRDRRRRAARADTGAVNVKVVPARSSASSLKTQSSRPPLMLVTLVVARSPLNCGYGVE
jgi:hypothetical protein